MKPFIIAVLLVLLLALYGEKAEQYLTDHRGEYFRER